MNDDRSRQDMERELDPEMEQCAPGCYCKKIDIKTKVKVIICLLIAIAATFISMYVSRDKTHDIPTATQKSQTEVRQ